MPPPTAAPLFRCFHRLRPGTAILIVPLVLTASAVAAAGLPVPERGFVSVTPARTWEQGLLCGNGTIGANVLSRPLDETIILTHERLYLPGGAPTPPPDTASRLPEMRQLIARDPNLREGFRRIIAHKLEHHYQRAGFMSFGISQLGQAAASLGESDLAYQALVRMVNYYWLDNLASTHSPRAGFNMDLSGSLPAMVLMMLLAKDQGVTFEIEVARDNQAE